MNQTTGRWRHRLSALAALGASLLLLGSATPHSDIPAAETNGLTGFWSVNGVLDVTLRAAEGKVRLGDLELDGAMFNGQYAGPVLHVRPGDMLRVRLVNDLSQPTNLHFHGMQGSPLGNGDNAHLSVAPGHRFIYEIGIPRTQPPGLYYYHSHLHGLAERQVMAGLSGALVVEPPDGRADGPAQSLFILKDMVFDDDTGNTTIDDTLHGLVQSINGGLDAEETMRPGETRLWRFTNQSADRPFHIAVEGHRLRVVARDGSATIGQTTVDVLDIMPSSRADVLIEGGAPGRYALLSKKTMTGTGDARSPDRVLGHLTVAGPPATDADSAPAAAAPPVDLRAAAIDARRTVVFTQTTTLKANAQKFMIDGKTFDPDRIDVRVPLGHIEEWIVRNDSDDLHVFHIHQLGFQVVAINGAPVPFTGRVDTVQVPERGAVTLRLAFTDPLILGRFMFHCHVLKHEDKGMMANIEIYDPQPASLQRLASRFYLHVWWWLHGVPWTLCGLGYA